MTALQLFGWQKLDIGTFLKADFSIMVRCALPAVHGVLVGALVAGRSWAGLLLAGLLFLRRRRSRRRCRPYT